MRPNDGTRAGHLVPDGHWRCDRETHPRKDKAARQRTALPRAYLDPEGAERSKSFPDRQKKAADDFLVSTENDKRRGTYIDPDAGAQSFRAYAEEWLESQTFEESTREAVALRLRKHILPHLRRHTWLRCHLPTFGPGTGRCKSLVWRRVTSR
jgi:hypothetical protein